MHASVSINIAQPKAVVWQAICDIEHSNTMISAILAIDILDQPSEGLIGLKWRETRKMFGKEATEVMWVTEAEENHHYTTRAENHGAVYISRLSLVDLPTEPKADSTDESTSMTQLTMTFNTESQSRLGKILASCMGVLMKGSMHKMLKQDLVDIKNYVEKT
jgi:phospholipase/lecithinase/hemolysin